MTLAKRSSWLVILLSVLSLFIVACQPLPPVVIKAVPDEEVTLTSLGPGAELNDSQLALSGRGRSGSEVIVLVDGVLVGGTRIGSDGAWSLEINLTEPGDHQLQVKAINAEREVVAETEPVTFSFAPEAGSEPEAEVEVVSPSLSLPDGGQGLNPGPLLLSGQGQPDGIVQILIDGQAVGATDVGDDGTWSLEINLSEPGQYQLSVQALAAGGSVTAETEPVSVSLEAEPESEVEVVSPSLSLPDGGEGLSAGPLLLSGEGQPGGVVQILIDGQSVGETEIGDDGTWSLEIDLSEPGQYQVSVQALAADGSVVAETEPVSASIASSAAETEEAAATETEEAAATETEETATETEETAATETEEAAATETEESATSETEASTTETEESATSETESSAATTMAPDIIFPANGADILVGQLTLIGPGKPGAKVEILDDSAVLGTAEVSAEGEWSFTFEPAAGDYQFTVRPDGDQTVSDRVINVRVTADEDSIDCDLNPGFERGDHYVVGTCDTLSSISQDLDLNFDDFWAANPQVEDPDLIYPGQFLTLSQ